MKRCRNPEMISSNRANRVSLIPFVTAAALAIFLAGCGYLDVAVDRNIVYATHGKEKIALDVYRRQGLFTAPQTGPAVILVHGGAWKQDDKENQAQIAQELAHRQGMVCFSINYRLATNDANRHPAAFDDVQRAVRWVRANGGQYGADTARIALLGGSAGAHLALLAAFAPSTRNPGNDELSALSSSVKAVVDMWGPSDLAAPWDGNPAGYPEEGKATIENFLGTSFASNPSLFSNASPIHAATASSPPVLIFHGTEDATVPPDQSQRLKERLLALGRQVSLVPLVGEKHGVAQRANWEKVYSELDLFFKKYL